MLPSLHTWKSSLRTLSSRIRPIQPSLRRSFVKLPSDLPIEEETYPCYAAEDFYPVRIGQVLNGRYRVSGKIGYGAYSTSWVCRDLHDQKYVVVKVSTSLQDIPTATDREYKIYEHLTTIKSDHRGQAYIRSLYDTFELQNSKARHSCLVHSPMQMTILDVMGMTSQPLNLSLLKETLQKLLLALDFLHTEANIVHLDLKTDNLMLSLGDETVLDDFVDEEARNPSPRKEVNDLLTIYQSRTFRRPCQGRYGVPVLCDFGEARIGKTHKTGPYIQPHIYRAPEIIFEMQWGSAADIWNVGALIWDLFEGEHLFDDIFDSKGRHDPFKHLALMAALLGPPPAEFVRRSQTTEQCFDVNGAWIAHNDAAVPSISLETLERRLVASEKPGFLEFLRSMLTWLPEERKTAKQLLNDPWLQEPDVCEVNLNRE